MKLLAIVQPVFSTYLTNRGLPFDLFTGWSVLNRRSVYKPDILPHRFGMSVKLAENYNAVNIITPEEL
ncbi:MAG TPA: hypothetical protein DGO89_18105 [Microcoleaceae bacterium UBA9251]|nr:hypothetical protein [Microcoleaceae cyanobacterium UBA11344]HCV29516.1 hypothetical protein [Microcoleaceae cyanobacterium UBA9251]HCV31904.1 hypothetical protein [Microcoleaceae cyanobacterium UBA9251]